MLEATGASCSEDPDIPLDGHGWQAFEAPAGRGGTSAAAGHACVGSSAGRCAACPLGAVPQGRRNPPAGLGVARESTSAA